MSYRETRDANGALIYEWTGKPDWETPFMLQRISAADIDEIATLINLFAYDFVRPGTLNQLVHNPDLKRTPSMPYMVPLKGLEPGRRITL